MLVLMLVAGLVLLLAGGDLFVRGAVGVAARFNVSPLLIGLTLVGFGTSTPELLTSIMAALQGSPGIAIGNIVGSNTANILLILGVAALIYPLTSDPRALLRDGAIVALAAIACLGLGLSGHIGRLAGLLLLLALVGYMYFLYRSARDGAVPVESPDTTSAPTRPALLLVWVLGGFGLTLLGAHWLVTGAIGVAEWWGVSDTIIGLTLVAVGTSLPELATSVIAALRRQSDIALGNILGSNIFNVFGILGVTALVEPVSVPSQILGFDIWVMLGATALLLVCARTGNRICRAEGGVFLALYTAYIATLSLA